MNEINKTQAKGCGCLSLIGAGIMILIMAGFVSVIKECTTSPEQKAVDAAQKKVDELKETVKENNDAMDEFRADLIAGDRRGNLITWFAPTAREDQQKLAQARQELAEAQAALQHRPAPVVIPSPAPVDDLKGVSLATPTPASTAEPTPQPTPSPVITEQTIPQPTPSSVITERTFSKPTPSSLEKERAQITDMDVANFLEAHLQTEQRHDVITSLGDYATDVAYYDNGTVDQQFIKKDKQDYFTRWPVTQEQRVGEMSVRALVPDERWSVAFRSRFRVENPVRREWVQGQVDCDYVVGRTERGLKIFTENGRVVEKQKATTESGIEESIRTIRNRYAEVNRNLESCQQIKRDLFGYSTERGELTTYLLNSSLRKMVARFYGESGQTTEEYYFWDNRLFFVFRIDSRYDNPLSGRVIEKAEQRFYFSDGELIRWLAGMKEIPTASSEAEQRGRELLDQATEFSNLVKGGLGGGSKVKRGNAQPMWHSAEESSVPTPSIEPRKESQNNTEKPTLNGERYPQTRQRLLGIEDIKNFDANQVRYAINEVYARHGATFPNHPDIQRQFQRFNWYRPQPNLTFNDIDRLMSDTERENVKVLAQYRMMLSEPSLKGTSARL
jgi:hypothetical protein